MGTTKWFLPALIADAMWTRLHTTYPKYVPSSI